jgi:anti-sigma regulatory factor (Ser/Thr protein kinase)
LHPRSDPLFPVVIMTTMPVEKSEQSSLHFSSEGLTVHMRIPSDWIYLNNAILTLREICEHLDLPTRQANRIILVLEEIVMNAMEHAYSGNSGLIDLQFSVSGSEFILVVEDFGQGIPDGLPRDFLKEDEILCERGRGLLIAKGIADRALVQKTSGGGTRATLLFQLSSVEI